MLGRRRSCCRALCAGVAIALAATAAAGQVLVNEGTRAPDDESICCYETATEDGREFGVRNRGCDGWPGTPCASPGVASELFQSDFAYALAAADTSWITIVGGGLVGSFFEDDIPREVVAYDRSRVVVVDGDLSTSLGQIQTPPPPAVGRLVARDKATVWFYSGDIGEGAVAEDHGIVRLLGGSPRRASAYGSGRIEVSGSQFLLSGQGGDVPVTTGSLSPLTGRLSGLWTDGQFFVIDFDRDSSGEIVLLDPGLGWRTALVRIPGPLALEASTAPSPPIVLTYVRNSGCASDWPRAIPTSPARTPVRRAIWSSWIRPARGPRTGSSRCSIRPASWWTARRSWSCTATMRRASRSTGGSWARSRSRARPAWRSSTER